MMTAIYENKFMHNKSFLETIENDYPQDYFDWKVTIQFYYALHVSFCILTTSGISVSTSHRENINALRLVDTNLSRKLYKLLKFSKQSRYDGFLSEDAMLRINKINYQENRLTLKEFEKFYTEMNK